MKSKSNIINKIVSIISIVIFGFTTWHYIDYLIRYFGGENFCFGYPIWGAFTNIGLGLFAILLSIRLFKGKLKLSKSLLLFILIGFIMWITISGLFYF